MWCHLVNEFVSGCAALELTPVCFQLDVSTYELERLHTKVTSLCNRIEQLQCHNAKDRLAQSGMGTPLPCSSLDSHGHTWAAALSQTHGILWVGKDLSH